MSTDTDRVRRGPGRPRGGDGAATRARIIAASLELFANHGFRATALAQIAKDADLSPTALTHHFPHKEALLAEVLALRDQRDREDLDALEPTAPTGWQVLERLCRLTLLNSTRPQLVRLFVTVTSEAMDPDHPAHAWTQRHYAEARQAIVDDLADGIRTGTVAPETPTEQVASSALAMMDGLQTQWLLSGGSLDMAGAFATYVAALHQTYGSAPTASPDAITTD